MSFGIIIRGKKGKLGKTRSEQEKNLRKENIQTMSNKQLDQTKYFEKKFKEKYGKPPNFVRGGDASRVE